MIYLKLKLSLKKEPILSIENKHNQVSKIAISNNTYVDAFITLVYAGAVSMLLSVGFEQEIEHIIQISFLLFIYLDWVGRIWTPLRLNLVSNEKTFDKILILLKSIIEVGIVFCLVQSFFIYFKEDNAYQSFTLFGFFLLLSAAWNTIVILQSKIKLPSFLCKCFFGNVTHDNEIKYYIAPYTKKINQLKEEYDKEVKNAEKPLLFKWTRKSAIILVRKFIIEIIAQIAALHLIVINFLIGVAICIISCSFFREKYTRSDICRICGPAEYIYK